MKAKYFKYLDISTAHMTKKDDAILTKGVKDLILDSYEYGYRIYISKDTKEDFKDFIDCLKKNEFSKSFIKVFKWARKKDMDWVQFDADGYTYPNLDTH